MNPRYEENQAAQDLITVIKKVVAQGSLSGDTFTIKTADGSYQIPLRETRAIQNETTVLFR